MCIFLLSTPIPFESPKNDIFKAFKAASEPTPLIAHDSNLAKSDSKVSTTLNEAASDHFEMQLLEKKTKISPLSEAKYTSRMLSALLVIENVATRRISFVLTNVYAVTCSLPTSSFPKTTKLPPAVARAPVMNQFFDDDSVVTFS